MRYPLTKKQPIQLDIFIFCARIKKKGDKNMHKGIFIGENAKSRENRIMILGESHHTDGNNQTELIEANYKTSKVIADYYKNPHDKRYRIFDKIMLSFEKSPNSLTERKEFWESCFFANYIDVLCGVGNNTAKNNIYSNNNYIKYNNELFDYINKEKINTVFCFSRLVFNCLPNNGIKQEIQCGQTGRWRDFILKAVYEPNIKYSKTDVVLDHSVCFYGMRHPAARCGYDPVKYSSVLKPVLI